MKKFVILFLALSISSVAFADMGPGPADPQIEVGFIKNNQPYTSDISLVYQCNVPLRGAGPIATRTFDFTCSKGICKNDGWFYKFNPCFSSNGSLRYMLPLQNSFTNFTETLEFREGGGYKLIMNLDKNSLSSASTFTPLCPFSFVLLGLIPIFLVKKWN